MIYFIAYLYNFFPPIFKMRALLFSPGWSRIPDPPASVPQMPGSQAYSTLSGIIWLRKASLQASWKLSQQFSEASAGSGWPCHPSTLTTWGIDNVQKTEGCRCPEELSGGWYNAHSNSAKGWLSLAHLTFPSSLWLAFRGLKNRMWRGVSLSPPGLVTTDLISTVCNRALSRDLNFILRLDESFL